jgi:protein-tyrosine-phosphatase
VTSPKSVQQVLCVCVGNISRSPMMSELLQRELGDGFVVQSAGLDKNLAGRPANRTPTSLGWTGTGSVWRC